MFENNASLLALLSFAFVASITPGPNNFMVMASGAAFGWRRTIPHMVGIALGFAVMIGSVVLGFGAVLQKFPQILFFFKIAGTGWLLWLAWQMAKPLFGPTKAETSIEEPVSVARPMRFIEAAAFQWINPKAWAMAVAASSAYSGVAVDPLMRAAIMAATFAVMAPICNGIWVAAGHTLQSWMLSGSESRVFGYMMVFLVLASAVLINLG